MSQLTASVIAAALFFVVGSPFMYSLVQSLLGGVVTVARGGSPTLAGLLIHSAVFGLATLALMAAKKRPRYGYNRY
jgi:hypothetical protein